MPVRYTNPRNVLQKAMQLIIYPFSMLACLSPSFLKCFKCEKTSKVVTHKRHYFTKNYKKARPLQSVFFIAEPEKSSVPFSITELDKEHDACPAIRLMIMTFLCR